MSGFRCPELPRDQILLIPEKLDDVVDSNDPVRHFDAILGSEPFAKVFAEWELRYSIGKRGQPPYHPRFLASLYIYGLLSNVTSSRKLEAACRNRIDVMWLMSGQVPDHTTISNFVKKNSDRLKELFKATVDVGVRSGLVSLDHVSIDGTKIAANASGDSIKSEQQIQELIEKEVAAREAAFSANDARDEALLSDQEVEPGERERRLRAALENLERRREESSKPENVAPVACTTDPDARMMKDKKSHSGANYNAQLAVDADSGIIVAADLNDEPNDTGQLRPQLEQTKENCGKLPNEVSADSAYNTGPDLEYCEEQGVVSYMPDSGNREPTLPRDAVDALKAAKEGRELTEEQIAQLPRGRNGKLGRRCFERDEEKDRYICPMGKPLTRLRRNTEKRKCGTAKRTQYRARASDCNACPLSSECRSKVARKNKAGRILTIDQYESYRESLRERMATEHGRAAYRKRAPASETPFAVIKSIFDIRRFRRRGTEATGGEWAAICTAANFHHLITASMRGILQPTT